MKPWARLYVSAGLSGNIGRHFALVEIRHQDFELAGRKYVDPIPENILKNITCRH